MLRELLHLNYTAVVFQSFLQLTASLKVTQLFFFSTEATRLQTTFQLQTCFYFIYIISSSNLSFTWLAPKFVRGLESDCAVKYVQPGLLYSPTTSIAYFHELNTVQST